MRTQSEIRNSKPRNYEDAMVEDLAATHARTLTELDFVRRTALQAQNMAKEIAAKLDQTQTHAEKLAEALRDTLKYADSATEHPENKAAFRRIITKALTAYESEVR